MSKCKITGIVGIEITCEECNELCVSYRGGSQIITPDDEKVLCEACGTEYTVPSNAFVVPSKNKRNADLSKTITKLAQA